MRSWVARFRARLGDFWFYSLMLFLAGRAADGLNFFVGAYLVPKFIDPDELGAVLPLASFATVLALPAYAFAMTFMKEVNRLASAGKFGQLKSLMRGVFVAAGVFLIVGIVIAHFTLPHFMTRLKVMESSLGLMLVVYAFIGCVSPIYSNALQALKKFTALSVIGIVSAPVRALTMLIALPIRPLTGFFVGQSSTPAFNLVASLWALKRELHIRAEKYWTAAVCRRFGWFFLGVCAYQLSGMLLGLYQQTILRTQLPALDSAAYYLVSRFSDITNFFASALLITLFPYTSEMSERGRSPWHLVSRSSWVLGAVAGGLAVFFAIFGRTVLSWLPHGGEYAEYAWTIPWLVGISAAYGIQCFYTNTAVAVGRFGFLKWYLPYHLVFALALWITTEPHVANWGWQINSLTSFLIWLSADAGLKLVFALCTCKENQD